MLGYDDDDESAAADLSEIIELYSQDDVDDSSHCRKLYNLLSLKLLPIYRKLSGNHNCNLLLAVLKVSAEDGKGNKSSVTVHLYGPNTDLVVDRKRELQQAQRTSLFFQIFKGFLTMKDGDISVLFHKNMLMRMYY
uniref:Uncharacterized protein n=1 Tax=Oryza nivara TaxID=4536 RepID=A0A0E0HDQ2_ORYNI